GHHLERQAGLRTGGGLGFEGAEETGIAVEETDYRLTVAHRGDDFVNADQGVRADELGGVSWLSSRHREAVRVERVVRRRGGHQLDDLGPLVTARLEPGAQPGV